MLGCRMAVQETGRASFPPTPVPVHSSALARHRSSTPKPWPPAAPVFWVGKSLRNKTKCQMRKLGQSATVGTAVPGQLQGGDPGWWGRLLTEASLLSSKCCLSLQVTNAPRQACPWALGRRQKEKGSSEAARSRHRKPSLRVQVSRTIHTEVNLPAVDKEKTV